MEQLIKNVESAAANLKLVANGLHVQLDVSTFDKALAELVGALKQPDPKPEAKAAPKPDNK